MKSTLQETKTVDSVDIFSYAKQFKADGTDGRKIHLVQPLVHNGCFLVKTMVL